MSGADMKRTLVCVLLSTVFSGCTTTIAVPVVKEALKCELPASMLAACGDPGVIQPGITFGQMIEVSGRDRDMLKACALGHKSLAEAIAACNDSIEKYNGEIRELNARNAARQ
jgi:hypothetical protein